MSALFLKRSAFIFMMFGAFTFYGGTALADSAPRIHLSNNWAGYAALDDAYTGISAEWVVPDSSQTSNVISADASWVGIGGITDNNLIQAGTQAILRNGKTQYIAWYELLPDTQRVAPLVIHGGDHVFASVSEQSPSVWHIAITDYTTKQTFQANVPYHSSHSSAEWIVERPLAITGDATGYLPLSNFGTIPFTNTVVATANGKIQNVSTSGAEQLIMSNSDTQLLAEPQSENGNAFTVAYLTPSQSDFALSMLRQNYSLQPQTDVSSRLPHYQEINTDFILHIIFDGRH